VELKMISLEQARVLAEENAKSCFADFVMVVPNNWLREAVFEEKNCWLFLKNKSLVYRENCEQWTDAAIVISKKGKVMVVADHHEDEAALKGYLEKISIYLEARGE
jgi:hypothetical protein